MADSKTFINKQRVPGVGKNQAGRGGVFECIDAHTCGNPVRLVKTGIPELTGRNMSEKRQHFLREYDWIRTGLMFEPRGHDMMSGSMLFRAHEQANDAAVLFIETSGCLPMCGHGLIGTITIAIEEKLIQPLSAGTVRIETPAGLVIAQYNLVEEDHLSKVRSVKISNVPSFLFARDIKVQSPLGVLTLDVAYGGNFYAIIDQQPNFKGIDHYRADELISYARLIRQELNQSFRFVHPEDVTIQGCSHVMWCGEVMDPASSARNAVVYGEKAIDRSPCGTGTSARMAQWYSKGKLKKGEAFIHESIIGSKFLGRVEEDADVKGILAIRPSIEGWARVFGKSRIVIDPEDDPYAFGFQVL
jgi:4-hydroxyproline epimerase